MRMNNHKSKKDYFTIFIKFLKKKKEIYLVAIFCNFKKRKKD